jgi:TatD DNase family protein
MKPQFIDAHAHVNFPDYDADRGDVVKRALDAGVWMINVGVGKEESKSAVELAEKYPEGVYAIIGQHPTGTEDFDMDFYRTLAKSKKVVGIGECGLDFFRVTDESLRKKQEATFRAQIDLALELDLPLMLHVREAYDEALAILAEYKTKVGDKLRGDFHFFAGDIHTAQKILDIGFTMSFTGVITFAREYEKLIKYIPLDKMLSETDCPYVTPVPNRGKGNEPLFVRDIVSKIARIKGDDEEKIQAQLLENAFKLFQLTA